MLVLDERMLTQTLIAFMMIAVLALVLRWTFGRDKRRTPPWPPAAGDPTDGKADARKDLVSPGRVGLDTADGSAPEGSAGTGRTGAADTEDYGLLAPVARVETAAQADRMRAILASAGIRATTARMADGRFRVLVFAAEVHRARRVAGPGSTGSTGAGPGPSS